MEKKINYLSRTYDDFRSEFQRLTRQYYPDMMKSFSDASVGQWFIDLISSLGDDLSYHIDRTFQETNINSATSRGSVLDLARSNGFKVPGKKSAMVELELTCELPLEGTGNARKANELLAPIVKNGTLVSNGAVTFMLTEDVNFAEQFNSEGISNRQIIPIRNTNGVIEKYLYKKLVMAVAGEYKVYKKTITEKDIVPFMEILIDDNSVLGIDSVLTKQGINFKNNPSINEFMKEYDENSKTKRFYEVESLIQQYRFGDVVKGGKPQVENVDMTAVQVADDGSETLLVEGETPVNVTSRQVFKGEWKALKHKFITEYTNNGQMKVIFGAGNSVQNDSGIDVTDNIYRNRVQQIMNNEHLGVLPEVGTTLFILYRTGGGAQSNVAANTITNFIYKNVEVNCNDKDGHNLAETVKNIKDTLKVNNPRPAVGGKDEPSEDEIRYMIKYNNGAQNRCVTLKDYYDRLMKLPARYGTPFRAGVIEENNKVSIYMLGVDSEGYLTKVLPITMAENIQEYLKMYRMINDYVELRSGKVVNLSFELDVYVDKTYDKTVVVKEIIDKVYEYMHINNRMMGDDVFVGDLQKEISKIDGVINLIEMRVYNEVGGDYSNDASTQQYVSAYACAGDIDVDDVEGSANRHQLDLKASDGMLISEPNTMLELKYKDRDIRCRVKLK